MSIELIPVSTKSDLNRFVKLPWIIYDSDPYWVPPLISEVKNILNPKKNPFFEHAEVQLFLAYNNNDGKFSGRIASIVNHNHISFHSEKVGFFGFFEAINDYKVAAALFQGAADWLKSKGLEVMRGPVNPSTNDECGLLIEGYNSSPYIMMTYNLRYYSELIEGFGFKKSMDLLAYQMTADDLPPEIHQLVERVEKIAKRKRLTIRPLDMKHFDREVAYVKQLYNSAWAKNWGFVPMTDKEIEHLAKNLKQVVVPELVLFAELDGEPIGMVITLPDANQAIKVANGKLFPFGLFKILREVKKIDGLRILILGVKEEYRNLGIDAMFYAEIFKRGRAKGYKRGEMSWILETNTLMNRALVNMGAKLYKRYRIYDYSLT
jgi:GNAT superfamily N-acetyltransferase